MLARYDHDAKVIAGGQSLVPAMNFRLARPAHLVDINGIADLDYLRESDRTLCFGALKRHCAFELPVTADPLGALLADVCAYIAHWPIRFRGTFAGSLSHADPAAEWCLVAQTLGAEMVAVGPRGERVIPAESFFKASFVTDLQPTELLKEVRLPRLDADATFGFSEFSRRAGDFALAMTLSVLWLKDGKIADARVGVGAACSVPVRVGACEASLIGKFPGAEAFSTAADLAAEAVEVVGDIHGSPEYRRDLVRTMTRRSLEAALL